MKGFLNYDIFALIRKISTSWKSRKRQAELVSKDWPELVLTPTFGMIWIASKSLASSVSISMISSFSLHVHTLSYLKI
jgi:hypothetical protein